MGDADNVGGDSLEYLEDLYEEYLNAPEHISEEWRGYFAALAGRSGNGNGASRIRPTLQPRSIFNSISAPHNGSDAASDGAPLNAERAAFLQDRVDQLVRAYRVRGHMIAQIDPLGIPRPYQEELSPAYHGLTEEELQRVFSSNTISGTHKLSLRDILLKLRNTYCRSIGVEFMHINSWPVKKWLQDRMESSENRLSLEVDEQRRIYTRLVDATIFEEFIQKKYIGAKSFSLEGAESLIPLLSQAIERAGEHDIDAVVIGMAHRGRLNVLCNIMGKMPRQIFQEFEDNIPEAYTGRGDVKYHLGQYHLHQASCGKDIALHLCFNPSHLEFVNTVAQGRLRAKMDQAKDFEQQHGLTILIHGDAAFAGEGVVQETLNLSQLTPYTVGGTIHIIVNNQIGFTTPPEESRSSRYATDVAKIIQSPIFHVNGEDPEAVAQVVRLSMDFRRKFKRDVVIDMYAYRRRGHNESDEPSFTQPLMYKAIQNRKSVHEGYLEQLLSLGQMTRADADTIHTERRARLDDHLGIARREAPLAPDTHLSGLWGDIHEGFDRDCPEVDTGLEQNRIQELLGKLAQVPDDFAPHPKLRRLLENRHKMARGEMPLDWAAAEALAFASILTDGIGIRMTGQDAERGTFSHRHAVLHDCKTDARYTPLRNLTPDQARLELYNSALSEAGVLGFEFGYSIGSPHGLVIWEAQFGDFANTAQVLIDQFISTSEDKWSRLSGLVMLLPHGYEGMGPEHSSARLERFLTLAAEDNIQVVNPTTPAQYFHLLRRQVMRKYRKPLIVMAPKSLLRHPACVSPLDDFTRGTYERMIPEAQNEATPVRKVLLCSGKIYYELLAERTAKEVGDVPIFRLEQYYPIREEVLEPAFRDIPNGTPVIWVQEEPENMGAWRYLRIRFGSKLLGRFPFHVICRPESSSPATGSSASHKIEQHKIVAGAVM